MSNAINRRNFIKGSSAALAFAALRANGMNFVRQPAVRKVALIGTGWYGKSDLFRLIQVAPVEVVALCDVDKHQLDKAADMVGQRMPGQKRPQLYGDYRNLLNEQKPDIVLIGSPDHWHALHTIDALKAGAHVYVQKPISTDVLEGEAMLAAARQYKKVVQVGMQRRSTPHLIDAKKNIVDAGLLGKVSHVELCCYYHMRNNSNLPLQPVPDFFDYEMWTGPAPMLPYDGLPHRRWRAYMEYGNGIMGDMCVHMFDAVRWMLNLGWPNRVSSTGGIYMPNPGKSNIADTQSALFEYDGLNCIWQHRTWGTPADPNYPWAFKIYGEKGTLCGDPYKYDFIPVGKAAPVHRDALYEKDKYPVDVSEPDIEIHAAPATRSHMLNFLDAIDTGGKPVADIEQGHISTASCIIANLSMKLGRPLAYDPTQKVFLGDPEATKLLQRPYRGPWIHP
ncbi:MAG: Gfo/Idh/MocA family oxidoreductase [Chitinophagaceae bacterium]